MNGGSSLNSANVGTYVVESEVADANGSVTWNTTLTINKYNEAPYFTNLAGSCNLSENTNTAVTVFTITAYDKHSDFMFFTVDSVYPSSAVISVNFGISTGAVQVLSPVDYETVPVINITLSVSDGFLTSTSFLEIFIDDVNDLPVVTGPSTASCSDNIAGGTVVFSLAASDQDGNTMTYNVLQSWPAGAPLSVDSSGELIDKGNLYCIAFSINCVMFSALP